MQGICSGRKQTAVCSFSWLVGVTLTCSSFLIVKHYMPIFQEKRFPGFFCQIHIEVLFFFKNSCWWAEYCFEGYFEVPH